MARDAELEAKRKRLCDYVAELRGAIAVNMTSCGTELNYLTVPPMWDERNPGLYKQAIKEMEDLTTEIYNIHQDIIRTGKRKLGV